jgi:hypothetical protein
MDCIGTRSFAVAPFYAAGLAILSFSMAAAASDPFDCKQHRCGLPSDGAYTKLVVGTLTAVASKEQSLEVLQVTRKQGWWGDVPDGNEEEYLNSVAIVAIKSTPSSPVTVMMTPQEFASAPLKPGDLVRYTPHLPGHERPQYEGPHAVQYYALTGCVAVLCNASDRACFKRYRPGIYRLSDGVEVWLDKDEPVPSGARVDPRSLLPVGSENK